MNGHDIDERTADRWQWVPLWIAAGLLLVAVAIGPSVVRYELDLVAPAVFIVPDELTLAAAIGRNDAAEREEVAPPAAQATVEPATPAASLVVLAPPSIPSHEPQTVAEPTAVATTPATAVPTAVATTPATAVPTETASAGPGATATPVTPTSRWTRAAMAEPTPVKQPEVVTPQPQPTQQPDDCTRTPRWSPSGTVQSCEANESGARAASVEPTVSKSAMEVDDDSTAGGSRWRSPGADASPTRTGRAAGR